MTSTEAIELLKACKALAGRINPVLPEGTSLKYTLTKEDLMLLEGFRQVQNDPIAAGPGLLGRLLKAADVNQVEVYKLDQLQRLVSNRRYMGKIANIRYKSGTE